MAKKNGRLIEYYRLVTPILHVYERMTVSQVKAFCDFGVHDCELSSLSH
jgi:hypothetical protein